MAFVHVLRSTTLEDVCADRALPIPPLGERIEGKEKKEESKEKDDLGGVGEDVAKAARTQGPLLTINPLDG